MIDSALPPATLRLNVDREALAANWRALDRLSGQAETGAAVKADAYGLGVDIAVPALIKAGARQFFVAHWGEVPDVLQHTPGESIAVLHGVSNRHEAEYARSTGVRPVINTLSQAQIWKQSGGGSCHVMVDTGINRLGISHSETGEEIVRNLQIDCLMSHLASADEDNAGNARQLHRFKQIAAQLPANRLSLANSAGIALGPDYHFDLTRPGLSLYGGIPRDELGGLISPVATIEAAVLQMREVPAGESVGYNAQWTAQQTTRVAVVSLGYADGILRCWGKLGALHHNGTRLSIIGKISMDMIAVNCGDAPVKEGDFLQFSYDLPHSSKISGLSQYELLTVLGKRFDRT